MLTIINKINRMRVYLIPSGILCKAFGRCRCDASSKCNCSVSSLTIPAKERVSGLPGEIAALPEIVDAIKRGELEVKHERIKPPKKVARKARKRKRKKD
ncbi:MAG: hypothetical protein GY854_10690 [Deltaproteobacteria bacterium]|nr:hypothetical protein [Deltaproteobacteria bacterium]